MKKPTLKQIRAASTIEDLELLGIGNLKYDIGHRGGHLGFSSSDISNTFGVPEEWLPRGYGAYCNYLGGGVRGAVCASGYDKAMNTRYPRYAKILDALADACKRAYIDAEGSMNDEEDQNGETNWDAKATAAARAAGTRSAY